MPRKAIPSIKGKIEIGGVVYDNATVELGSFFDAEDDDIRRFILDEIKNPTVRITTDFITITDPDSMYAISVPILSQESCDQEWERGWNGALVYAGQHIQADLSGYRRPFKLER